VASVALAACSPQGQPEGNALEAAQAGSPAVQPGFADRVVTPVVQAKKQTVVMTRNLKPDAIKTGKPLPHKRIVLKRGQRIDVLDSEGMTSFVGPVTIGPDGQTVSGGGGQEDVRGFGGAGYRIDQIGGVRVEAPSAAARSPSFDAAPEVRLPPAEPLPPADPPK
jgi:hypothetical protein